MSTRALADKETESLVELNWIKPFEIEATLANGTKETILLEAVKNLEGEDIPCLFSGVLDHDSEDSDVMVDGCKEDTQVLVEILSPNEVGGLLVLVIEDGKTYGVKAEDPDWMGDAHDSDHGHVSEVFNTSSTRQLRRGLPREVFVTTTLAYDNSLLQAFNNDLHTMKNNIEKVARMAQPLLRSLDVKVNLRWKRIVHINVWGNPSEKFANQLVNWYRNHDIKGPISIFVGQRSRTLDLGFKLIQFFSDPWNFNTIGWAMYDSACDTQTGRQFNTNLLKNGIEDKKAAEIFAHELGHNLGMR